MQIQMQLELFYDIRKGVSNIGIAVSVMGLGVSSIWIGFSVIAIGVSDPPSVTPDCVVSVRTRPVELKLMGLGVSPDDVAVVGDLDIVGEVLVDAVVCSMVEREIGVPTGFETI